MKTIAVMIAAVIVGATFQAQAAPAQKGPYTHASSICKRVQAKAVETFEARKTGHNDPVGDKARLGKDSQDPMFTYAIDVAYESDLSKTDIGKEAYDYCMLHKASS